MAASPALVDEQVTICKEGSNTLVSSRKPEDLAAFARELVEVFSRS